MDHRLPIMSVPRTTIRLLVISKSEPVNYTADQPAFVELHFINIASNSFLYKNHMFQQFETHFIDIVSRFTVSQIIDHQTNCFLFRITPQSLAF